jgi:SulP family sulfate permease
VAAFSGGYPVGGSFSRSSINRLAGAKTRWSGGVTGLIVIAFLPFASVLEPLPTAVLGAIVLAAASSLVKPLKLLRLWQRTKTQALLAWATAGAVLAFTPRVERAVILGVILTTVLHLSCRFSMDHVRDESGRITVQPVGMIWLANDAKFEQGLRDAAKGSDNGVTVDFARIPFLNDATIDAMSAVRLELNAAGHALDWTDPPAGSERMLSAVTTRPEPTQAIDGGTGG